VVDRERVADVVVAVVAVGHPRNGPAAARAPTPDVGCAAPKLIFVAVSVQVILLVEESAVAAATAVSALGLHFKEPVATVKRISNPCIVLGSALVAVVDRKPEVDRERVLEK
jgi:hypothetical protein